MQRNIKDMSACAFEPGCHTAQLIVMLQQEYTEPLSGENVGRRQSSQTATDHDNVIGFFGAFQEIAGHWRFLFLEFLDRVSWTVPVAGYMTR